MNGLDSKNIPHPCESCDKSMCNNKYCAEWKYWFNVRWNEVTAKLRRDES
jgi:hypothetical protein